MLTELIPLENAVFPLWIKISYTLFVFILVPVYWKNWGPANFLWFSDVALFGTLLALWMESSLIASMMGVAVLFPEVAWNISYFTRLLTGKNIFSLTDYMFDSSRSLFLRALSLFHVIIPVLIIWLIAELGFDNRSLFYQIILGWAVLLASYFLSDPKENVNWVFGPGSSPQNKIHPLLYLLLVMIAFPLVLYLPTYLFLRFLF
ncbi:MAG: membrane-associated protein [Bacteroidia bacterium]